MNIIEALDAALPELPARTIERGCPKLDPRMIAREHLDSDGNPMILAKMPGNDNFLRLSPGQWQLLQLFDGDRSYEEVAEEFTRQTGEGLEADDIREFTESLARDAGVFRQTALEKNVAAGESLRNPRRKRAGFSLKDVTEIHLLRWPNANNYISKLHPYVRWIYTRWCTALILCLFGLMLWMWGDRWHEIWRDSFQFYNFRSKSLQDFIEFWFLFGAMAFIHESAHGVTCKHFGGDVEKMGFLLMYFAPTFYCDVTQVWIYGGRFARVCTILAGLYADLIVCAVATIVWWSTSQGMFIHDFAYKWMMVTGLGVTILNLNPLIKLDGYYLFSEVTGHIDLKERSQRFYSTWIRRNIYRLPVELEYVPRSRKRFYLIYAAIASAYGYMLVCFFALFLSRIFYSIWPVWGIVPSLAITFFLFRSRLRTLKGFLEMLYLDKKELVNRWMTPPRLAAAGVLGLLLVFAPIWPDRVDASFTLEPAQQTVLHARVPGTVTRVLSSEGKTVAAGDPVLELENTDLTGDAARASADLEVAQRRAIGGELRYVGYGQARRDEQRLHAVSDSLHAQRSELTVVAPFTGTILTPRLEDLEGSYLKQGDEIARLADCSSMLALVYVPEFSLRDVHTGSPVRLLVAGGVHPLSGTVESLSPENAPLNSDLLEKQALSGIRPPGFYVAVVRLKNDGELRPGVVGTAKVWVTRRSVAGFAARLARDMVSHRLW
jgi:putative peptide zinc metalloprotease protein